MSKKLIAAAVAAVLSVGAALNALAQDFVVDPAIAGMTVEQKVEARQNAMRQNGGIVRGLGEMSPADASIAASTLIQNLTNLPELFAADTMGADVETKALPLIWEEKEAFDAIFAAAREHALAAKAAADAGDVAAAAAAAGQIGPFCGQCHGKYRAS